MSRRSCQHDLEGSGRFHAMPRARMLTNPSRVENVQLADWKADGNDYVAVGRVTRCPMASSPLTSTSSTY